MRKTLLAISIIGSMRIGSVFAISLNSSNIVSMGCATDTTSCSLNNMNIDSIETNTFINHTSLIYLDLRQNNISSLEPGDFNGLINVGNLNLDNNRITSLESGDFDGLPNLGVLNIESNQITSVGADTFSGHSNMRQIFARYNKINGLVGKSFAGMANLNYLALSYNDISFIDTGAFLGDYSIQNLYLEKNKLTEIKYGIFSDLESLFVLDLRGNRISSIESGDFIGLSNLQTLHLGSNQIRSIESDDLINLPLLHSLALSNNQITSIEAGSFPGNIRAIALDFNEITSISDGLFDGLGALSYLYLSHNKIESINENTFVDIPMIMGLELDHNNIISNPGNILYNSSYLFMAGASFGYNCKSETFSPIYFNQNLYYNYIGGGNCGNISSINPNNFVSTLTGVGYTGDTSLLIGSGAIKFASTTTNKFLVKTIMFGIKKYGINQGIYIPPYTEDYYLDPVEVEYNSNTVVSKNGVGFTGVVNAPILFNPRNTPGLTGGSISIMRFGSFKDRITFDKNIIIRMPARGKNVGDIVGIFSSDDESIYAPNGGNWSYEKTGTVINLSGKSYVEFTTNHASRWALSTYIPDITAPIGTISYSTTNPTSGNVIATITLNETGIITNNGGNNNYIFTSNGSFTFQFRDTAGNTGTVTANVSNIDKTAPIGTISYSTTQPINATVIATLSLSESGVITNNGGSNTYAFTGNGDFTFQFKDNIGNTNSVTATVTNIDKTLPPGSITYSTTSPTSGNVTAILTLSETGVITNNGGSNTYIFTGNGSFIFTFIDNRGANRSITATVNNIDKTAPIGIISYSVTEPINANVIATINLNEEGIITNNGGDSTYLFTNNGSFTFQFRDSAGNTGTAIATVANIDKTLPAGSISYSTTSPTNGEVTATVNFYEAGSITNNGGSNTYTFNNNGSFTFQFVNTLGHTGYITATVNNIDRTKPIGTVNYSTISRTNQDVVATVTLNETGVINSAGGSSYTFTGNGSFTFTFTDNAGNTGSIIASVNNIDKTKPIGTINYSTTGLTNQNVLAILSINKPESIITNNNGNNSFTFTGNGNFTFQFRDNLGNTGTAIASVANIDKEKPVGTINYSTTDPFNGIVTAKLNLNETGTIGNNNGDNTFVFTDNGSFMFYFMDEAGNTGSTTAIVDNINKNAPIGTISYSTTDRINGEVIASLKLNKSGIVLNNNGSNDYTFYDNGSFTFYFSDNDGNMGSAIAKIENINKMAPIGTIIYSTTDPTNKAVIAELKTSSPTRILNNKGSANYVFLNNGSFTFQFVDNTGNTGSITAVVSNIDRIAPIGSISYSTTGIINGDVVATIELNETGTIINNSGDSSYTFSDNGSFRFQFKDIAGNTGSIIATVSNIDKTLPIFIAKTLDNKTVASGGIYNTGVNISINNSNFTKTTVNGKIYTGVITILSGGTSVLELSDDDGNTTGLTFNIDTQKPICDNIIPSNKSDFSGTSLELKRECSDSGENDSGLSGLILIISDDKGIIKYSTGLSTETNEFTYDGEGGIYNWQIIATDKAGNVYNGIKQRIRYYKTLIVGITYPGYLYNNTYYLRAPKASVILTGNSWFGLEIAGDISNNIIDGYIGGTLSKVLDFSNKEGLNSITISYLGDSQRGTSGPIAFYIDSIKPNIRDISPVSGLITTGTTIDFKRTATDTGAGISGYTSKIIKNGNIVNVYTGEEGGYTLKNISNGEYIWELNSIDYAGNIETKEQRFTITNTIEDTSPEEFSLDILVNKKINYQYKSSEVIVSGLSIGTKIPGIVSTGSLFINGLNSGISGYIQNGDKIQIAMNSSKNYNEETSGILTIGDKYSIFKITTTTDGNNSDLYTVGELSASEKLNISVVFKSLMDIYNTDKEDEFITTFQSLIKNKIETLSSTNSSDKSIEKIKYLYNLISKEFNNNNIINDEDNNITYIAPNGKKYSIEKDIEGYTSSTFIKSGKYFSTLREIKEYINKNNRKSPYSMIDFTIDKTRTKNITAPNNKKYILFKTTDGRYGSNNFRYGKLFNSLSDIEKYINNNNRGK